MSKILNVWLWICVIGVVAIGGAVVWATFGAVLGVISIAILATLMTVVLLPFGLVGTFINQCKTALSETANENKTETAHRTPMRFRVVNENPN